MILSFFCFAEADTKTTEPVQSASVNSSVESSSSSVAESSGSNSAELSSKANRLIAKKSDRGRVVKIDFDDELLIKGKVLGPSLFTLYQKRNVEFGRLIKPRKNFLPEMRATLGDIK